MRYACLPLLFVLTLCTCVRAQTAADFNAVVGDYFPTDGPGGTMIVVKDGEAIFHEAFGKADVELDVDMQAGNVFRIGSITKQFTAAAILKLAEDGQLKLDDEITRFLPDYPTQDRKITIHHLLNHTSGIQSYTSMIAWTEETRRKDFSPQAMIDFFANAPMLTEPGDKWEYNNSGYFLLGYLIEKASGMTYEDYIEKTFFEPLGMDNSRYGHPEEIVARRATGYDAVDQEPGYGNADYLSMTQPYGAGSLLSTVEDLSTWYHAVAAGKVISQASLAKAITPTVLNDGSTEDYGYGLSIVDVKGSKGYGHGGGINGFLTASTYLSEEKIFVAVFSNCTCKSTERAAELLAEVALGKYEKKEAIAVPDELLESYVGKYALAPSFVVTITKDGDHLVGQATGQGSFPMYASEKHRFFNEEAGLEVRFNVAADGSVPSFTLFQGGEQEAKRVE